MFEDRTDKYDFKKYDKIARTQVMIEEKTANEMKKESIQTEAHKKLFNYQEDNSKNVITKVNGVEVSVLKPHDDVSISNKPSTAYLKQFENQIISDEKIQEVCEPKVTNEGKKSEEVIYKSLIESANDVKVENRYTQKELEKITPKPKKNYSFRIKLACGVYCILVALFGGWAISNAVDIAQTNSQIYETVTQTSTINQNVFEIVSNINNLNNASSDPNDDTILVKIVSQEIDIIPEEVIEPNQYQTKSNWFDALCNWISSIFGG